MTGRPLPSSSAPLPPGNLRRPEPDVAHQLPRWMCYALAFILPVVVLIARLALGFRPGDAPILIVFVVPIVLSAYVGGLGPGLLATALAAALAGATLLPLPIGVLGASERTLIQLAGLLISGILISALSERLHRARQQADSLWRIYATTLAAIGDGVITTDAQGRITLLNAEAERLTAWSYSDALGRPITDVFHIIDDKSRVPIEIPSITTLRSGMVVQLRDHTILIGRDGRETPIDDSATPIGVADAPERGSVLVFRDVTGRDNANIALRESQERLAGIVGAAMDAIISIDATQRIVIFNTAASQMFGIAAEQVMGQPIEQFIPLAFRGIHASHIRTFGHTGVTSRSMHSPGVLTALRADGTEFPIEATIAQTLAAGQPLYTVIIRDISARIQAEQALRQSESRFATAFRASPIAMSITRLTDGLFIDINTSHEKLFGYPRSMLIGQSADGINIYADPTQRAEVVRTMRETGALRETELALRTRSGEIREVLCSLETIEVDGEACILGSVFDITARKQAEAALRASEERFRQVFLANPSPELITRINTREIIDANPAFARMTGYARDELIGQTTDALGLFLASDQVEQSRSELVQAGQLVNHELPIRIRDGSVRDLLLSVVPVDLNGVASYLTVMLDQTERKQAETARRRAVGRLRVLADAARAFAEVAIDHQALLEQIARTTTTALGEGCIIGLISSDQVWMQPVLLYDVDPERNSVLPAILGSTQLRLDEPAVITRIIQTNQTLLLPIVNREQLRAMTQPAYYELIERIAMHSLIGVPMRVQGRPIGAMMLYRCQTKQPAFDEDDLTLAQDLADRAALAIGNAQLLRQVQYELAERARAEDTVRLLNAELEQRVAARTIELTAANKELEAFSYSVSHDLRAPLRAIDGFSRILLEDYVAHLPDEAQHYFQMMRSNAQQMGLLVDDLLAFSRLSRQPLRKQMVDSLALVRRCLEDLHAEQEGRQIEIRLDALPSCEADPALLKQVWINLIANAIKYTRQRDLAIITISSQVVDGETIYSISDNGVGFDMRYRDKLFGVFQRMHRAEDYEGTGVGLAIIQRIIHRHGGRVWADAVVDQGATFFFTLG